MSVPVVAACDSDLAVATAAELVRRRLARASGRGRLVALAGCSAGCCTARTQPDASFDLSGHADAAAAADAVAPRLGGGAPGVVRQPKPARARRGRRHTHDDYLLALAALSKPVVPCGLVVEGVPVAAADLARVLGVSRPAAGEMVGRLCADGLVERTARRRLRLTARGRAALARAEHRRSVLERFAVEFLQLPRDRAASLAPGFDDDALARLERALARSAR